MSKFPQLPVMQCDVGCGACCGVVLCKDGEFSKVMEFASANGISPVRQGVTCPWYQEGKCSVYPVRPGICKAFGHIEGLDCKHGYNVNVQGTLKRRVHAAIGNATRCLHEALGDGWEQTIEAGLAFTKRGLFRK